MWWVARACTPLLRDVRRTESKAPLFAVKNKTCLWIDRNPCRDDCHAPTPRSLRFSLIGLHTAADTSPSCRTIASRPGALKPHRREGSESFRSCGGENMWCRCFGPACWTCACLPVCGAVHAPKARVGWRPRTCTVCNKIPMCMPSARAPSG